MVIRMLEVRRGFQGSFSAKLGVDEFDPKQIAPTMPKSSKYKGKKNVPTITAQFLS